MRKMSDSRRIQMEVFEASRNIPVVAQFYADWCGPCQVMKPTMNTLAEKNSDKWKFSMINIEKQPGLAAQFGIRSIPTVVMFHDEEPVAKLVGSKPSYIIQEWLDNNLPEKRAQSASKFDAVNHQLRTGNLLAAKVELMSHLIQKYKDEPLLKIMMAMDSIGENNKAAQYILESMDSSGDIASLVRQLKNMLDMEEDEKDVQTPTSSPFSPQIKDVNSQIDINVIDFRLLNQLVHMGINEVRKSKGTEALTPNDILYAAARDHNNYMMQHDQLTHYQNNNPNKKTVMNRVQSFGGNLFNMMGENVQYKGFPVRTMGHRKEIITGTYLQAASDLVENWVNSLGHYKNLINPKYKYVGTEVGWNPENASLFATQVFGA